MQSLETAISALNPSYLGQALSPRYELVRSRLLLAAREVLAVEYASCLKVSRSKPMLRRIHDLDRLTRRLRFLGKKHGEPLAPEAYALIERERSFRKVRHLLRRVRSSAKRDGRFMGMLEDLAKLMKVAGLTNRDVRVTVEEMRKLQKTAQHRDDVYWEEYRKRQVERRQRMAERKAQA